MRIGRETSFLLIVDMQETLVPAVEQSDRVVANAAHQMTGVARLEMPVHTENVIRKDSARLGAL